MEVATMAQRGERPRARALIGAPLHEFLRRYFTLRGWTDGPIGLFLALSMAYYAHKRVKLVRRQLAPSSAAPPDQPDR
jgi:hypothetical protein